MRMDQWCVGVGGLSRLRTFVTPTEIDIITRGAHSDRHEGGQPFVGRPVHGVCHRREKRFRSSGTRVDGRSLQTDSTRIMRDQKEHADTEGEVQMGTTRADGVRRLDEEAWEQCYDVVTVARWSPVNRGRRSRAGDEENCTVKRTNVICDHINKWSERKRTNMTDQM